MTERTQREWSKLAQSAELEIEHLTLEASNRHWWICADSISGQTIIAEGAESGWEENKSAALRAAREIFQRGLDAVQAEQVARDDAGLP